MLTKGFILLGLVSYAAFSIAKSPFGIRDLEEKGHEEVQNMKRVINGTTATAHAWPWQISLRVDGVHICGGALIKADYVLTAAQCVTDNPDPAAYTVVVGWGETSDGGSYASYLQETELPVADHRSCAKKNGRIFPVDEGSMICAEGMAKGGGCRGDSGSPFVCEERGRWVLRGVGSWADFNCNTSYYSVFARVSAYVDAINRFIGSPQGSCGIRSRG